MSRAPAACVLLLALCAPALAATKKPALTGNLVNDIQNAATANALSTAAAAGNALAKPFQDLASFIADDSVNAIKLSTQIPGLQDGNGQACWTAMQSFAAILHAHPIPATLNVESDIEALRLAQITANNVCSNIGCRSVFDDLENLIQKASPLPVNVVPISFSSLCAQVPQIQVVAPSLPAAPAAPAAAPSAPSK